MGSQVTPQYCSSRLGHLHPSPAGGRGEPQGPVPRACHAGRYGCWDSDAQWPCGPGLTHQPCDGGQRLHPSASSSCAPPPPRPPFPKALGPGAWSHSFLSQDRCGGLCSQGRRSVTVTQDHGLVSRACRGGRGWLCSVCLLVGPDHWGSHPAVQPVGCTSDPLSP